MYTIISAIPIVIAAMLSSSYLTGYSAIQLHLNKASKLVLLLIKQLETFK